MHVLCSKRKKEELDNNKTKENKMRTLSAYKLKTSKGTISWRGGVLFLFLCFFFPLPIIAEQTNAAKDPKTCRKNNQ